MTESGAIRRLYSRRVQAVLVGDRMGNNKAYAIAEEKAKAAIIRFIGQMADSRRKVTEILSDVQSLSTSAGAGGTGLKVRAHRRLLDEIAARRAKPRTVMGGISISGRELRSRTNRSSQK